MTPPSLIDFRVHAVRTGSDEAGRVDFHRMLSALVGMTHPTATDIRADPGDWGIDVFVGSLVESILIWQSKYFYTELGNSQKAQIRESFKSAMANAEKYGYMVEAWTLCVACELSAPERRWWDGKVREWKKAHPDLHIDLWDAPRLRRMLMSPDVEAVWREFYGPTTRQEGQSDRETGQGGADEIAVSTSDTPAYEGALFVRQMAVAGITATDAQKTSYFNADLLARDVAARSVPQELAAVREIDTTLLGNWEDAIADPETAPNAENYQGSARRLFSAVMQRIPALRVPLALPVRNVHLRGFMHKIVDGARAGWVHDWKDVAVAHDSPRMAESAPRDSGQQPNDEVEELV